MPWWIRDFYSDPFAGEGSIDIFFEDIYSYSPPSKPQIEEINISEKGEVKIIWLRNNEPDLAGYILSIYTLVNDRLDFLERINIEKNRTSISINEKRLQEKKNLALSLTSIDDKGSKSLESDFIELIYNMGARI